MWKKTTQFLRGVDKFLLQLFFSQTPQTTPSKKGVSSLPSSAAVCAIQAFGREKGGFELSNEMLAEWNSKIHAKLFGQRMIVESQRKAT